MSILVAVVIIFALSLKYAYTKYSSLASVNVASIVSVSTVILPSISSLMIAFIKLPKIIAKYLFNIQEDRYMNSVIKNIQDYDRSMFALSKKATDSALMHRTEMMYDEDVKPSPKETIR